MKWTILAGWLSLWVGETSAAVLGRKADLKALLTDPARGWSKETIISFPDSDAFTNATQRWSIAIPPTYSASISPGTEKDVVTAVKLTKSDKLNFLATGGRHGFSETLGKLQEGLAIDLSLLNSTKLNKRKRTLTVGPGVSIGDIMDPISKAGFMLQTASAHCPSVIGVTLGGGIGRFTGLFGLMIDSLVSVRVVTADGKIVEASHKKEPDLFWAIRGAGANFGIVIEATYRLHPQPNKGKVMSFDIAIPAAKSSDFFKAVETYNVKLPAELAGVAFATYNSTLNEPEILTNWVYVGDKDEAMKACRAAKLDKALEPILALKPARMVAKSVRLNKLLNSTLHEFSSALCNEGVIRDIYSANLKTYIAATMQQTFEKFSEFYKNHPKGRHSVFKYEIFPNQAMEAVESSKTAWHWRNSTGYFQASMNWERGDKATEDAAKSLAADLRKEVAASSGYDDVKTFVNYAHGDEKIENVYGEDNLPRLAKLKNTWDSSNVFRFNNHPLPLKYP